MMKKSLKRVFWGVLILQVVLFGASCKKVQNKKSGRTKEIRVTLEPLQKRLFKMQIPVQGTVTPVEHATISAKVSGTLELLKVNEGDTLKKGDVLFGIDRQVLKNQVMVRKAEIEVKRAELDSAKVALETAEISVRKAKQDYDRYRKLFETKAVSSADYENYETAYKKSQSLIKDANAVISNAAAQLRQAETNLTIAKKNLDDSVLKAPFNCIVVDKFVEANEYVAAGEPILKLENHQALEVICYISSVYYDFVKEGKTKVEYMVDGVRRGEGVIYYRAPSIDPESRTFKIKSVIPTNVGLVSGMLCDINIIMSEKSGYGLPADAILLRANDRYIAYAINHKKQAQSVEIKRGITDGKYCEVLNYQNLLKRRFVVTGQTFVNTGSQLRPINEK